MIQHCPVLIVLLPLTAALLCLLFSKFNKNLGSWLVIGSIAGLLAAGTASNSDQRRSDPLLDGQLGTAFGH